MDCEVPTSVDSKILKLVREQIPNERLGRPDPTKLCCVFEASFRVDSTNVGSGVVAVTPHNISLFKKEKRKCSLVLAVNVMRIRVLDIEDESKMKITARTRYPRPGTDTDVNVVLVDDDHTRFWQVIWRNVQLHALGVAERYVPRLSTDNERAYPLISLDISPAQRIQFGYSAFCSIDPVTPYDHRLIQLFNRRFAVSNFVLDFSQIPATNSVIAFARMAVQSKAFTALVADYDSKIEPWTATHLFLNNEIPLKVISVCGDNFDMEKLAALVPKSEAVVWKLSGKNLTNKHQFMAAFAQTEKDIRAFDFSYMGLSLRSATALLKAIMSNEHLQSIEVLGLSGVYFKRKLRRLYQKVILKMHKNGTMALKRIMLGNIGIGTGKIAYSLVVCETPLEAVDFSNNTRMSVWSINQILQLVTRLKTVHDVDISHTNFTSSDCAKMAEVLGNNGASRLRILRLNEMKLGKRIAPVLSAILDANSEVWGGISFDKNKLDERMAALTTSVLTLLPNLHYVSLSYNFSSTMVGVGQHLAKLMELKSLKALIIRGHGKKTLRNEAKPIIAALGDNDSLVRFDISGNCLGNSLYSQLCDEYERNSSLKWLNADCNAVTDIELIKRMMRITSNKTQTLRFELPSQDINAILKNMNASKRSSEFGEISSLHMGILMAIELNAIGTPLERRLYWEMQETMAETIINASYENDKVPEMQRRNLHTCASSVFKLPLPFQSSGDDPLKCETMVHVAKQELHVLDTESLSELAVEKPIMKLENEYSKPESTATTSSDSSNGPQEEESDTGEMARKTYKKKRRLEFAFDTLNEPVRAGKNAKRFEGGGVSSREGKSMEKARLLEILHTMYVPELQPKQLQMSSESDSSDSDTSSEDFSSITASRPNDEKKARKVDLATDEKPWMRRGQSDSSEERKPTKRRGRDESSDTSPKRRQRRAESFDGDRPRKRRHQESSSEELQNHRKKRVESSEDDRPRRRYQESSSEDEPRARRKKRVESSDEDRPRKRRHQDLSSEDELRNHRKKRVESSDDDRPRKRRQESSEDEPRARRKKRVESSDDDRPRKRRRESSSDEFGGRKKRPVLSNEGNRKSKREKSDDDLMIRGKRQKQDSSDEAKRHKRRRLSTSSDDERTQRQVYKSTGKGLESSSDDNPRLRRKRASTPYRDENAQRANRWNHSSDDEYPRNSRRRIVLSSDNEDESPRVRRQRQRDDNSYDPNQSRQRLAKQIRDTNDYRSHQRRQRISASGRRGSSSDEYIPRRRRRNESSDELPRSRQYIRDSSSEEANERRKAWQRTMRLFDVESDSRGVPKRSTRQQNDSDSDSAGYRPRRSRR